MATELHNELKKEFQLERIILFSDAVFAIAITLLVIEIKIPERQKEISDSMLAGELGHLIPKFIGFLITFMLVGLYWTVHHRMFGYVVNYSKKLIVLNLMFLFFIALMPFSTGFYSEFAGSLFSRQLKIPLTFYVMNFFCAGMMIYFMWVYISNPKNNILDKNTDKLIVKQSKARSLIVPLIFLSMIPVAYFGSILIAVYLPMLIPVITRITNRIIRKKHKPAIGAKTNQ